MRQELVRADGKPPTPSKTYCCTLLCAWLRYATAENAKKALCPPLQTHPACSAAFQLLLHRLPAAASLHHHVAALGHTAALVGGTSCLRPAHAAPAAAAAAGAGVTHAILKPKESCC